MKDLSSFISIQGKHSEATITAFIYTQFHIAENNTKEGIR